tara:strand:+ start:335 stop:1042 length:708 start_codon:yes stop_codon:yes gene_type:complete
MATIDLGKIKLVWRGTYNNGTAYVVDDLVAYTDTGVLSTYICVANSTGNAPSSGGTAHASWNYVSQGQAAETNASIRTKVEAATDSNVFTDADHTKLNGIEASATADQTGSEILALINSSNISTSGTITDGKGNVRSIPKIDKSSAHTLVATDAGKAIRISTGGITVNESVMSAGDAVTIINNSGSNQTITQGSNVNLYNAADGTTGNRTLAGRGMATLYFVSDGDAYISGAGLS